MVLGSEKASKIQEGVWKRLPQTQSFNSIRFIDKLPHSIAYLFALIFVRVLVLNRVSSNERRLSHHLFFNQKLYSKMAPKVKAPKQVENTQLGPQAREGEEVFGVAHIYASFNDTFVVCRT